jgi:hypothetical protein
MRKVLAHGPAVVVSMVLTFVVGTVLPATVGLALFVGGVANMVILLLGAGGSAAVRFLFRARVGFVKISGPKRCLECWLRR